MFKHVRTFAKPAHGTGPRRENHQQPMPCACNSTPMQTIWRIDGPHCLLGIGKRICSRPKTLRHAVRWKFELKERFLDLVLQLWRQVVATPRMVVERSPFQTDAHLAGHFKGPRSAMRSTTSDATGCRVVVARVHTQTWIGHGCQSTSSSPDPARTPRSGKQRRAVPDCQIRRGRCYARNAFTCQVASLDVAVGVRCRLAGFSRTCRPPRTHDRKKGQRPARFTALCVARSEETREYAKRPERMGGAFFSPRGGGKPPSQSWTATAKELTFLAGHFGQVVDEGRPDVFVDGGSVHGV